MVELCMQFSVPELGEVIFGTLKVTINSFQSTAETEEPDRLSALLKNTVKYSSAGKEEGPKAEPPLRCSEKIGQKLTSVVLDILEFQAKLLECNTSISIENPQQLG